MCALLIQNTTSSSFAIVRAWNFQASDGEMVADNFPILLENPIFLLIFGETVHDDLQINFVPSEWYDLKFNRKTCKSIQAWKNIFEEERIHNLWHNNPADASPSQKTRCRVTNVTQKFTDGGFRMIEEKLKVNVNNHVHLTVTQHLI